MFGNLLPSVGELGRFALKLVIVAAIADLLGFTSFLISPVSAYRNRAAA